jgi:hypothetical protein
MTLAIGLAPVALDLCQATCAVQAISTLAASASHDHGTHSRTHAHPVAHAASGHHQHPAACHDAAEPSSAAGQAVHSVPGSCSHSDDLPASAGATPQQALLPPAVVATTLDFADSGAGARSWTEHVPAPIPLRIAATTQLRV